MADQRVLIGTSGWHYQHWSGPFCPEELTPEDYLRYYCRHFPSVEINNTFYQLPEEETLGNWRQQAPVDFICSVKASRYLTHLKKLKDPRHSLEKFLDRITILGDRLGPVLFQLPPNWRPDLGRLRSFLAMLPGDIQSVFEFRDRRWFQDEILELLEEHEAAFCVYHLAGEKAPREVTADLVYIRLHGPEGAYEGKYSTEELAGWAGAISSWTRQGKQVYCYFDNDDSGYAPQNAARLLEMFAP